MSGDIAILNQPRRQTIVFGRALIRRLVDLASELTGIPVDELVGPNRVRLRDAAWTRFAVATVAHENGKSMWQIANAFGQRDHSTIMHGIGRSSILSGEDPDFAELLRLLRIEAAK